MRRLRLSYIELPSLADRRGGRLPDLASARHDLFALCARLLRTADDDWLWEWSGLSKDRGSAVRAQAQGGYGRP